MSRGPAGADPRALTVVARRVLLDATTALSAHLDAIVLVGAQAVYLRTADADLTVAAYTSDGDLGLDPVALGRDPRLEQAMASAQFSRQREGRQPQPGSWFRSERVGDRVVDIAVDLLVPDTMAPSGGRRSARLPPHDGQAARRVPGLEPAIIDNALMRVDSLEPELDSRSVELRVANIPALIMAKAWKLGERLEDRNGERAEAKDAGDLYRLLISSDLDEVRATLDRLGEDQRTAEAITRGVSYLRRYFSRRALPGVRLAQAALATAADPDRVADIMTAAIQALLEN